MTYTITGQQQVSSNSLNVIVDYTLNDGTLQSGVVVAIFSPQTQNDVINAVIARGQSIQNELNTVAALTNLLNTTTFIGQTGTI